MFVNPYTPISRELHEIYVASDAVRVSLLQVGSLHSMLRVLNLIKAGKNTSEAQGSLRPLKSLVDQIDRHASKWFDQLPHFLKRSNVESGPEQLMLSVMVTTYAPFPLFFVYCRLHAILKKMIFTNLYQPHDAKIQGPITNFSSGSTERYSITR